MQTERLIATHILLVIATIVGSLILYGCSAGEDGAVPDWTTAVDKQETQEFSADAGELTGELILTAATTETVLPSIPADSSGEEVAPGEDDQSLATSSVEATESTTEVSTTDTDSHDNDEVETNNSEMLTGSKHAQPTDILNALESFSSVGFTVDSVNNYTLNYDNHKIPITVDADAKIQVMSATGEMALTGQMTMITSGQKKITPIGVYIVLDEKGDYVRYTLGSKETWHYERLSDKGMVYFHPDHMQRYVSSTMHLSPDSTSLDPESEQYSIDLMTDFLSPLLSPVNSGDPPAEVLPARIVLNPNSFLPIYISIDADQYVGQMLVDSYKSERSKVTLSVENGRTELSNFRYGEAERIELPFFLIQMLTAETVMPDPAGSTGKPDENGNTWSPDDKVVETELSEDKAHQLQRPRVLSEEDWASVGEPLIDSETGVSRLTEEDILDLLADISIEAEEYTAEDGNILVRPRVYNGTDYILQRFSVTIDSKGEDLKINTNVSAILPQTDVVAKILEDGEITPNMLREGKLKKDSAKTIVAYLIDRDENIVLLTSNRREDGSLTASMTGKVLALGESDYDIDALIPTVSGPYRESDGTISLSINNNTDWTLAKYDLLYLNKASGDSARLSLDQQIKPGQVLADVFLTGRDAENWDSLIPLTLTFEVGKETFTFDYVLNRLIRTNY